MRRAAMACPALPTCGLALADAERASTRPSGQPRRGPLDRDEALIRDGVLRMGALVEGAMGDGCTLVNPREPTEEDFEELFRRAL